jgi:putative sterol carrier protein
LKFRNVIPADVAVRRDGVPSDCAATYDKDEAILSVGPVSVAPGETLEIVVRTEGETLLAERDHRWHTCMKLLRACRLNTELKRHLNTRLSDILADPSILGDFELALGERLARALFEIVTGAGVHKAKNRRDGSDEIILWNNSATPAVTCKFVAVPLVGWLAVRKRGPLPRFMSIQQGEDRLVLLSGGPVTQETSVTRWLRSLPERFRPQVAGGFDATIQFSFPGKGGAEAHIRVSQGSLTLVDGVCDSPDLYVEADPASWLSLINGQASPEDLFLSGKLQVGGDATLAMRLADVIGGTAEQTRFRSAPWRLEVNYLDALRLEWERSE